MNAIEPRTTAQNAQSFLNLYNIRRSGLSEALPARDEAAASLRLSGLPSRRLEAWKYTDLRLLTGLSLAASPPLVTQSRAQLVRACDQQCAKLVQGLGPGLGRLSVDH